MVLLINKSADGFPAGKPLTTNQQCFQSNPPNSVQSPSVDGGRADPVFPRECLTGRC
jgi:hypothetical protein